MTSRSNYQSFSSYSNSSTIKIVNGKLEKFVEQSLAQEMLPNGGFRQVEVQAKKTKDGIKERKIESINQSHQQVERIYPDMEDYLNAHRMIPVPLSRIASTRASSEPSESSQTAGPSEPRDL